jgi:CBS domain-containing protein
MSIATIRKILGDRTLYRVPPDETIAGAARVMAENHVGAVVAVDGGALVGILTERDIVFRAVAAGLALDTAPVTEAMTHDPVTVTLDDAISDALAAKLGDAFRHLPVMDAGQVVGLLSYRDIPPEYLMMYERFREMSSSRADSGV